MSTKKDFYIGTDDDDAALRLAEATLDGAREAILRIRGDGRVDFANLAACRILGYSREELAARTISDIDTELSPGESVARFWRSLSDVGSLEKEGRYRRRDGKAFPVDLSISRLEHSGKEFALISARDISHELDLQKTLSQSEKRLHSVRRHAGIGFAEGIPSSDLIVWDENTYRIFGYEPGEVEPTLKLLLRHVVPEDRPAFEAAMRRNWTGADSGFEVEYRILTTDGHLRYIREDVANTRDENGKTLFSTALVRDVTEAKKAENSLRESETRLREAQSLARMGEWYRDLVNNELVYSDEIFNILGVTPETFVPSPENLRELIHPEDRDQFWKFASVNVFDPAVFSYSLRAVRPDGKIIHIEQRSVPILDDAGKVIARRGTIQDVTAFKETALALEESQAELNQAQAISHVGSWYRDLENDQLIYSDEMFRILGVERENFFVAPESFLAMVHPDDLELVYETSQRDPRAPQDFNYEHRIVRGDGTVRYIDHHSRPIFDEAGKVVARRGTMQDITPRKEAESALELAQLSLDSSHEAVFRFDAEGRVLYANPSACESLGYTADEILRLGVSDINPDIPPETLREQWDELRAVGVLTMEGRHRRKDGSLFPVSSTVSYVKRGEQEFSFVSARDISDRKSAEQQLRQSEQRLAIARRFVRIGVWEWDIESDESVWSDEVFLIYGYDPSSVKPDYEMFRNRIHPDDEEMVREMERGAIESGGRYDVEFRILLPDGETRHVHDSGVVTRRDARGRATHMTGIVQDITRRKVAEEALAESERLYRSILDNMIDTFYRTDREGKLTMVSPSAEALTGYSLDELIGTPVQGYYVDPDRPAELLKQLAETEDGVIGFEAQVRRKDGEVIWASSNARYWRDVNGRILGVEGTTRDVTAAREMGELLRQAQKMEAVGQLTDGIAHDFNNLLTVVIGNLAMVAEDLPAGNLHREMVDRAYLAAERGAKLTHRMLAFSRKQTLSPSSVDLNELTEEMRDILRVTLSETVEVALRLAPDLWLCWVDRVQMENSLLNLAINSRDAMPRGGRLVIETENVVLDEEQAESFEDVAPGEYVRLSISDNGCGIPQEYLDRVFEPFFSTKEVGQGSGLGLSMIYGFAKQSGGHVTIESEEGAGTTVTHYLPRWKDGDDGKGDD